MTFCVNPPRIYWQGPWFSHGFLEIFPFFPATDIGNSTIFPDLHQARLVEPLGLRMAHGPLPAPLMRLLLLSVEAGG